MLKLICLPLDVLYYIYSFFFDCPELVLIQDKYYLTGKLLIKYQTQLKETKLHLTCKILNRVFQDKAKIYASYQSMSFVNDYTIFNIDKPNLWLNFNVEDRDLTKRVISLLFKLQYGEIIIQESSERKHTRHGFNYDERCLPLFLLMFLKNIRRDSLTILAPENLEIQLIGDGYGPIEFLYSHYLAIKLAENGVIKLGDCFYRNFLSNSIYSVYNFEHDYYMLSSIMQFLDNDYILSRELKDKLLETIKNHSVRTEIIKIFKYNFYTNIARLILLLQKKIVKKR